MPTSLSISLNGVTPLPPGKIAAIETALEMRARPAARPDPEGAGDLALLAIGADVERYLAIYRALGERWMWFSRLIRPRAEVAAIIAHPRVETCAVLRGGRDIGLLELDFRVEGEVELAFFGLAEEELGRGAGRWLMNRALERAWQRPIARVWVHTCTLDHPAAIGFYERSGFRAFRRSVEVADDPRLSGHMPREAAAHHPLIEG